MAGFSTLGLLTFIGALSLVVWGLERDPPYDVRISWVKGSVCFGSKICTTTLFSPIPSVVQVFRGYAHTFDFEAGGGDGGAPTHKRLTREFPNCNSRLEHEDSNLMDFHDCL